jgi:hypothetical protein
MRIALGYLAQLDTMPSSTVLSRYRGHVAVAEAYYEVGASAQVITHLKTAFHLVATMPFERRDWLGYRFSFPMLADALSGLPHGREQIDSMTAWLEPLTHAPPALVDKDRRYEWLSRRASEDLQTLVRQTNFLGRPAPAIVANYWINTSPPAVPDSANRGITTKALNDGKIRILQLGHYGCPGCLAALPGMERMRQDMPKNVEVWYVSGEGDTWGTTRVTPQEMVDHLRHFYVDRKGYSFPIAIYIGEREPDVDGGSVLTANPLFDLYGLAGFPTFVVTDGHGMVRHISLGFSEARLRRSVRFLLAEAAHTEASH